MRLNSGADVQSAAMAGSILATNPSTATSAPTATTLTDTGQAWTVNGLSMLMVFTGAVYGVIVSNTATVLTIDRWSTTANPGASTASSTPSATTYNIGGAAPAIFMALTANASAVVITDTALTAEITTASGALVRKQATYAHSAGAASYTLTAVFIANASDSLPVSVAKSGIFNSMVASTGKMQFEDLLSAVAPFNTIGDQATITLTVNI